MVLGDSGRVICCIEGTIKEVRDLGDKVVTMDKCFDCITRVKEIRNELTLNWRYAS